MAWYLQQASIFTATVSQGGSFTSAIVPKMIHLVKEILVEGVKTLFKEHFGEYIGLKTMVKELRDEF